MPQRRGNVLWPMARSVGSLHAITGVYIKEMAIWKTVQLVKQQCTNPPSDE